MGPLKQHLLRLAFGALCAAWACMAFAPVADAQFFWWFDQPKSAQKPRVKPKPPGDDLPPIVPRESSAPPPPDDRPYDNKLMRLAEILGAVHYLRELCGAQEGQVWRDQMKRDPEERRHDRRPPRQAGQRLQRRLSRLPAHLSDLHAVGHPRHHAFQQRGRHDRRLARARLDLREQRLSRRQARCIAGRQQRRAMKTRADRRQPASHRPRSQCRGPFRGRRLARGDRQRVAGCPGRSSGGAARRHRSAGRRAAGLAALKKEV